LLAHDLLQLSHLSFKAGAQVLEDLNAPPPALVSDARNNIACDCSLATASPPKRYALSPKLLAAPSTAPLFALTRLVSDDEVKRTLGRANQVWGGVPLSVGVVWEHDGRSDVHYAPSG